MTKRLTILILVFASLNLFSQTTPHHTANFDLAARYSPNKLKKMVFSTSVSPHWLKNSDRFWYSYETSEGRSYYIVDPVRGTKDVLFHNVKMAMDMSRLTGDPFDAKHLSISKLKFTNNESTLQFEVKSKLVKVDDEEDDEDDMEEEGEKEKKKKKKGKKVAKVWHFEYDLASKTLSLLDEYKKPKDHLRWANISPDTSYVLFGRDHNLYWMSFADYRKAQKDEKDSTIVEHQWTTDGEEHYAFHFSSRGSSNVDIEKNKEKRKGVSVVWSPDSKKFAMIRSDDREVKDLWVINNTAQPRPTLETYKYHMAGETEASKYELLVFDFESKNRLQIEVDTFKNQSISILRAPRLKENRDDELRPSLWLSPDNSMVYFSRTSRDMKRVDICAANTTTGEVKIIIEERLNTYIDTRTIGLVNGGEEYIHWSERDGWAHFYLYNKDGNLKNQITSGAFHCQNIEGIDSQNRVLYFTANGREKGEDPYYEHLYRISFDGTGLQCLNSGNYTNSVSLNDGTSYFVNNYSRVNTTPATSLHNAQGRKIMDLETADLKQLFATGYQFPEPYTVKADDGITDLYGVIYKPFDFDSTKQYPLLEYVYPGPQTEAVNKSFSARMNRTDRMAQLGFIVITVGNRGGHPARSKWYHNYGYGNLRDYGLADKKAAAEQLADRHDFIDIDRVGIYGHSGGGFMSTAAMLVYPDFFKVAVSSAGNHDNSIYNRWWSEKHHGIEEILNPDTTVTFKYKIDKNQSLANNLKGKLLLATGDIDNNVHPAATIRMAEALIKANKRFDFFLFPGQRHGFGNMSEYFFWLGGEYFCEHLLGVKRDEADMKEMNNEKAKKR
ncbi:MAG: DPP IV N-terminal domain-containing protein [Saprospiraceae bacterium]|nr:DPP IV N-terminal domain-containing protein [Saprospiraceae bacterium]